MSESLYREGAKQGTQAPSPAPRLIPAETEYQLGTNMEIGTANGGTSLPRDNPAFGMFLNRHDFGSLRSIGSQASGDKRKQKCEYVFLCHVSRAR